MIERFVMELVDKYGVTGLAVVLLILVLKWVMKQQEKQTDIAVKREERLSGIMDTYNTRLGEHTQKSEETQNEQRRANEYQRGEHEKIIIVLDGIVQTVGRINGYRKDKN